MRHDDGASAITEADLRRACAELERRLSAGEAGGAESMLASHPEFSGDADVALELIYTEFVAREQMGQRPTPAAFCTRFPQWRDGLEQLFQIHEAVGTGSDGDGTNGSGTPFPAAERIRRLSVTGDGPAVRRVGNYELLDEIGR